MRLIIRTDFENYAESFESKGYFPVLISNLVRATTPSSTLLQFPSGTAANVGGWDGIVRCDEAKAYVPNGVSLWEFGTSEGNNGKAESDYTKRTLDPLGYTSNECTFIFATPTFWKDKDTWRNEKLKEGKWKDILVYDSRNLEEWISLAPAVSLWFARETRKIPTDGIQLPEEFLEIWCWGPLGKLPSEAIVSGRQAESEQLAQFFNEPPAIKAVRATSKDEAIAFIIASATLFEKTNHDNFFSKSVLVETDNVFRGLCLNQNALNLISRVDDISTVYYGASKGHHVLVPLGPDDKFNSKDIIELPVISKDGLIDALKKMGLSEDKAQYYSKESGRNITILKRLLEFPQDKLEWTKPENAKLILPALMLGRWDENIEGDRVVLEKLSGEKYEDYILKISQWRDSSVPVFLQIGTFWRLTSPMDAWANLAQSLTKVEFEKFGKVFIDTLSVTNPSLEVEPENRYMASVFGKTQVHSRWCREGLIQTLILIAFYGESLKIPEISSPQEKVDGLIKKLLEDASGELWASLNYEMPLIAEASPIAFLTSLEKSLGIENTPILKMFEEEVSFISPTSRHTGLLWALEGLAWLPEYLSRTTLILAKLSSIDPGGRLSNRPINSLAEIFKTWHYQTLASFDERIDVLKLIARKEKEVAWILLNRLLPKGVGEVGGNTHKMRWRIFDKNFAKTYTYEETWATHSAVIDILLSSFDITEEKFAEIIDNSVNFSYDDRNKTLDFIEQNYDKIEVKSYAAIDSLRDILYYQNSHPNSEISIPKPHILRYENLFKDKQPKDKIQKNIWLFNEHWPKFSEGYIREDVSTEEQYAIIREKRILGLSDIYEEFGIEKIKELSLVIKEPHSLGDTLAYILKKKSDIISVCELINTEKKNQSFIDSFLFRKYLLDGLPSFLDLYKELKEEKKYSNIIIAYLFIPVPQSGALWEAIETFDNETENEYWLKINPNFYHLSTSEKVYGIEKLIHYHRYIGAMHSCRYALEDIPTEIIVNLLEKVATEKTEESDKIEGYEFGGIFEELDKREDTDPQKMLLLEWYYLPILASYGTSRKPKLLYNELAKNPDFFVEVLKWVYIPKDKELLEKEREELVKQGIEIDNKVKQAYQLLNSWKKIPGVDENGNLNESILRDWIKNVREKSEKISRLEVADAQIAKILAQYPEGDATWPQDAIFSVIEEINTDSIKNNFYSALFNKRGSSSRGVFDGGNIERGHAQYFAALSKKVRNKFPIVSSIFDDLVKSYESDAKRMDESAERDKLDY